MNFSSLLSNAVFLALTFLPALYLNEYIQSQSTIIQAIYCLIFFTAVFGIDILCGKHLLKTSPKHPLISLFIPLWILFSIRWDWETVLKIGMMQFYVLNHCAMFVGLRMIVDWSKPNSEAPEQVFDYFWIIVLSLPFFSVGLFWHFSNSPIQIYSSQLIVTSILYYWASCLGCLLFASATIYSSSLSKTASSISKQQIKEAFKKNPSISGEEQKRIEEHLDGKN